MGWAARANREHTGTLRALARLAGTIATQTQFERLLRTAPHPERTRDLLEPMLNPNLPCCAEFALGGRRHATACPTQKVVLTDR